MRSGLDNPRTHFALRADQQIFVDAAPTMSFKDFERVCDYWKIAADPDGEEPKAQLDAVGFRARQRPDGMVKVDGLLDPLSASVLLTPLRKLVNQLTLRDEETGQARSESNRHLEALLHLVTRGAANADGTQPDPLINIVMSHEVAQDQLRRMAEDGYDQSDLPVNANLVDGRCELIDGTPLHPHYAMLLLLSAAKLTRVVMDADDRIIDASVPTRGFAKWQKQLLAIRQRGRCGTDGCDAPFWWLQADHVLPWSKGGDTSLDNGKHVCRPDNQAKGDQLPHDRTWW